MSYRIETGTYSGIGWTNPGFMYKFDNWITRASASGGAGWTLHDDLTGVVARSCTVTMADDKFSYVGHGYYTGMEFFMVSSVPIGITGAVLYYVIKVDDDSFRVASTYANALAGTYIDIGSNTTTPTYPFLYKIYRNVSGTPTVNQVVRYLKFGVLISGSGYTGPESYSPKIQEFLWWDTTTHIGRGLWNGRCNKVLSTSSDVTYHEYDFRGGTSFLSIVKKPSTTYDPWYLGSFSGSLPFLEAASVTGTLQSGVSSGNNITLQLNTGAASLFTVNNYYFIYDFSAGTCVDYVKLVSRNTGTDEIVVDLLNYNYASGAVIGAYPHRFYGCGTTSDGALAYPANYDNLVDYVIVTMSLVPYVSVPLHCMHPQSGKIYVRSSVEYRQMMVYLTSPTKVGNYYTCSPVLYDRYNSINTTSGIKEGKGIISELLLTPVAGMTYAVTRRSVNGVNYKAFGLANVSMSFPSSDSSLLTILVQDDEVA